MKRVWIVDILKGSWRSPVVHRLHFENHCIKCSEGFIAKSNLILDIKMHACLCACSVAQSCLTLGHPMDGSPPGSSVHRISKARKLEWVAISSCRGSSQPRDPTRVPCNDRWILYLWATNIGLEVFQGHLSRSIDNPWMWRTARDPVWRRLNTSCGGQINRSRAVTLNWCIPLPLETSSRSRPECPCPGTRENVH